MEQTTLYFRHGGSDKMYQASITPKDGGFVVPFAFGRRGTTLQTGTKTQAPVSYEKAKAIYEKLVAEKLAKGYTPGEDGTPYQYTEKETQTTGILPQLLNPIEEIEVNRLIADPRYWLQEKYDGRRQLIQKSGEAIIGINRRGLRVALPETLAEEVMGLPLDCILDGEAVDDQLHVFDLLRLDGEDLRPKPYLKRYLGLMRLASAWECQKIRLVACACVDQEKARMFQELRASEREGCVFKKIDEPYTSGRPASGAGAQVQVLRDGLLHRLADERETERFARPVRGRRRAQCRQRDHPSEPSGSRIGHRGGVPFPVRHPGVGLIYQPVYLGSRDDLTSEECTVSQLKYKPEAEVQTASAPRSRPG